MDGLKAVPSPLLQEANRQLHHLRTQAQKRREMDGLFHTKEADTLSTLRIVEASITSMPIHLGWGSDAVSAVIRQQQPVCGDALDWLADLPATSCSTSLSASVSIPEQSITKNPVIKLYPHIGLGMLRQEKAASGRLWLMLHHLDVVGSGQLRIDNIQSTLTSKTTPMRLCGKRQLRNLLRDGDGLYWTRDKERVWLHSAARVAHGLGVAQLTGRPVSIPVSALLAGIGSFRAHLYAAFHSGRTKQSSSKRDHQPMPIARETLTQLSGVGQSSQRTYEAKTKVTIQTNYAIGEVAGDDKWESRAWTQGRAVFELKDYRGEQGKKGTTYLAWQLPNSYTGKQQQRPLGRQKRINRTLRDLVMKGMPGNGGQANDTDKPKKTYYPNGKLAATAHGRDEQELYWRQQRTSAAGNRQQHAVWQQL
jgi:hypothetical protein